MTRRITITVTFLAILLASSVLPAAAQTTDGPPLAAIVKLAEGVDMATVVQEMEATWVESLIPSRGVYRVGSEHTVTYKDDGTVKLEGDAKKWLKDSVQKHSAVIWAEGDYRQEIGDERFHAWPQALPVAATEADLMGQAALADLAVGEAHALSTGSGVTVAVLDTGVDASHHLIASSVVPGYDLIDDDADPAEFANGVDDDGDNVIDEAYGHGTFIAGLIAQIAPHANILPIRVLDADGRAELYTVIEAIDLATDMGADVINMSFGLLSRQESDALDEALKRAHKAGVVVIAAAGNAGESDEHYPAAAKDVIAVTALSEDGELLAPFSNRGKWVHIAAPGVNLVSAIPGDGYAIWSGTSMATPVVASLAALLSAYAPDKDGKKVQKAILDGARKMEEKDQADKGIIDFMASFDKIS